MSGPVSGISFSPNSRFVMSTASGEHIVWHVTTGEEVLRTGPEVRHMYGAGVPVHNGQVIALSDTLGRVRVLRFSLPSEDTRRALCSRLPEGRTGFNDDEMTELSFLEASDRWPCAKPALLSLPHMTKLFGQWRSALRRAVGRFSW